MSALSAAAAALLHGDRVGLNTLIRIASTRGPEFSRNLSQYLSAHPKQNLAQLVELITRTHLLPGGEFARMRSAALAQIDGGRNQVNFEVARILNSPQLTYRPEPHWPYDSERRGRRFIVARSARNPYYGLMYSKLQHVGFNVQFVSSFTGILEALSDAQLNGERPHVHIDHWLTKNDAALLVSRLHEQSTLSISAHDLEQNASRTNRETGMGIYLRRAAAIHLLTESSLQRLGIDAKTVEGRAFHVPHPAYFGEHAGGYQFPRDRIRARRELGRRPDEFAVGIVGRVSDRKNVELLVSAAALLPDRSTGAGIVPHIYISGAFATKFAERIIRRSHGISNITVVAKDLDDDEVGRHVAALDVGVVPYFGYLNSGWTVLALSAGLPIIASRESTASEVVPPEALIDFSEGDARSLARAILASTRLNGEVARSAALARAYEVHPDVTALRFAQEIAARVNAQ